MRVVVYATGRNRRGRVVADAMHTGLTREGVHHVVRARDYGVEGDVAIAYGWTNARLLRRYPQWAYFDLGFWHRRPAGDRQRYEGAHRLSINSWDTADHMLRGMPNDRWVDAGLQLCPRGHRPDGPIIVAGMSDKAAIAHGMRPLAWERAALMQIGARAILRRKDVPGDVSIETALATACAIVSHHSNVSVDALIAGVPSHSAEGVGRDWSLYSHGGSLNKPWFPTDAQRMQYLSDVAYAQYTLDEMRDGTAWDYIKIAMGL